MDSYIFFFIYRQEADLIRKEKKSFLACCPKTWTRTVTKFIVLFYRITIQTYWCIALFESIIWLDSFLFYYIREQRFFVPSIFQKLCWLENAIHVFRGRQANKNCYSLVLETQMSASEKRKWQQLLGSVGLAFFSFFCGFDKGYCVVGAIPIHLTEGRDGGWMLPPIRQTTGEQAAGWSSRHTCMYEYVCERVPIRKLCAALIVLDGQPTQQLIKPLSLVNTNPMPKRQ